MPPLVYAASSLLRIFLIPYMLRERSEPDLRRRVIALRSATGFRPTKVLVANQHSGRDTRSTASVRTESNQYTEPAPFAPGAGAPTGGVTRSVVGAPPRCEPSQTNTPSPPIRTRGGCSYRVEVTCSVVGAPPRCEAKSNQYTEPVPFAPGAGAPTGWG